MQNHIDTFAHVKQHSQLTETHVLRKDWECHARSVLCLTVARLPSCSCDTVRETCENWHTKTKRNLGGITNVVSCLPLMNDCRRRLLFLFVMRLQRSGPASDKKTAESDDLT